jgi:hypothetical protein
MVGAALFSGLIWSGLSIFITALKNGHNYMVTFINHQGIWKKEQQKAFLW